MAESLDDYPHTCCESINCPHIKYYFEEDILRLEFCEFKEDKIEIKGQFFQNIEDYDILHELMTSTFHQKICITNQVPERTTIRLILQEVITKIAHCFLEDYGIFASEELEIALVGKD